MFLSALFYPVTFLIFVFGFIFTIVKYKTTKQYNAFLFSLLKWFFIALVITIVPSMFFTTKTPAYEEWTDRIGLGSILFFGFVVLIIIGIFVLGITSIILAERFEKIELQNGTIKLEETRPQKNKAAAVAILFVALLFSGLNILDNSVVMTKKMSLNENTKNITMRYLDEKYGEHGFKYISTEKDMHTSTFGSTPNLEGYQVSVISMEYGCEFSVVIDAKFNLKNYDDPENMPGYISDSFYTTIFEKQYFKKEEYSLWRSKLIRDINDKLSYLKEELSEFGDVEIDDFYDFNIDYHKTIFSESIPRNYGRMPTKEELSELIIQYAVNHTQIDFDNFPDIPVDEKGTMADEEKEKNIAIACEKVANKLVQILDTAYDINITCHFCGFDYGNVIITNEKVTIKYGEKTLSTIDL